MNKPLPAAVYRKMLDEALVQKEALKKRSAIFSAARLAAFLCFAVPVYFAFALAAVYWLVVVTFLALFIWLMVRHSRLVERQNLNNARIQALEQEIEACAGNYSSFDGCSRFLDPAHPYAADLDILGDFSLCQAVNRAETPLGMETLAGWLLNPLSGPEKIKARQEAVEELSAMPGWRVEFRALGIVAGEEQGQMASLAKWLEMPALFTSGFYKAAILLTPLISFSMLALLLSGIITIKLFFLYLLIPLSIVGMRAKGINARHMMLSRKVDLMKKYAARFGMVETGRFSSVLMQEYNAGLRHGGFTAGGSIRQLSRITSSLDTRLNFLAGLALNVFLLWDIRQIRRLELWQNKYREFIPRWFEVIAETEVLAGMAAFRYANPGYIFPHIDNEKFHMIAEDAGHPLIPSSERVGNEILLNGRGNFNIITGANMAGKSTYLRTIGVNLVLALSGCPVCAKSFSCYPAGIFTSLKTSDSLSASQSYFFAELLRLKELIDRLSRGEELFILLDEILKGTNSADKQAGSVALLEQLIGMEASGFIATHDLELGKLADAFPGRVTNYRFEAKINGDNLDFDYKLLPGIAQNMNATFLMKRMGITI